VAACANCGAELPAGARFCAFCGTPVETAPVAAEERRTVTIVFADLVGFTERSDRADPEDVRRTLVPFHRRVKQDLERFGGTLDKFIGDAVMGVFGAPVAHEDDPVRAVRAALRILDTIEDLRRDDPDIAVRIAVNTGEAVVAFGSGPQVGEAVAGDVVNTTSRMQSLAPRDAVVIGEETLRAVRGRFEVEALPTATVKGKSEPLMVWRVLGERAEPERERVPFVGRRTELEILTDRFDDVERSGSLRALVLVAEAGVGKSRLIAELANDLQERALTITGSCPPYGEGVTFAPVEQTVRALTGIEPSDDAATSAARLEAHAARIELDPQDRRWLVRTLGAVLALEAISDGATIGTEEIARAWALLLGRPRGRGPWCSRSRISTTPPPPSSRSSRPRPSSSPTGRSCSSRRRDPRPRSPRDGRRSTWVRWRRSRPASSSARCSASARSPVPCSSAPRATRCTRSSSPACSPSPAPRPATPLPLRCTR